MTVSKSLHVLVFAVLCLATVTLAQQQQAWSNPFLIHRQQHRQQQRQQIELKKLQMHMLKPVPPKDSPQQPPHQPPPTPSPPKPQQQAGLSPPSSASHPAFNPFSPPQRGFQKKLSPKMKKKEEEVRENRNEMHKGRVDGRPGPTPWTRWTSRPHSQPNPWQDQKQTESGDLPMCGRQRYSPREHICCDDSLQNRQGLRPACCGSVSFDFVFSLCCQGQVTPRTAAQPFC